MSAPDRRAVADFLAAKILAAPFMGRQVDDEQRRRDLSALLLEILHERVFGPRPPQESEMASLRVLRLEAAIRKHRDYRGDDRCHMDDAELYDVLPEGAGGADTRQLEPSQMLLNCMRFIGNRHDPSKPYLTSPVWVAEIMAERIVQDKTAGGQAVADGEDLADVCYVLERMGRRAIVTSGPELRSWFVRIAALAVGAVESFDRRMAANLAGIAKTFGKVAGE